MRAKVDQKLPFFSLAFRRGIRRNLVRWFDRYQRDLPWRRYRNPYHIWVSEVMLQQTQVTTVLRYYEPFILAFPSIKSLAAASEQAVLRQWEGMGYYRRAINLHQAARQLVTNHKGRVINDPEVFGTLPGVGRYILGAVLSQAFDRRLPIIEANSRRVLSRLLGHNPRLTTTRFGRQNPRLAATRDGALWNAAQELLPTRRVGDFNQSLMELGALVCTPRAPQCSSCPLSKYCQAKRLGIQDKIPGLRISPRGKRVREVAVVIRRGNRVLLVQRPTTGRWAGLWEFPHDQVRSAESLLLATSRIARNHVGMDIGSSREILSLNHTFTRFQIRLNFFEAEYLAGNFRSRFYVNGRWLRPSEILNFPVSSPHRRMAASLI
jgi:A/G-specific adenine glycosylase